MPLIQDTTDDPEIPAWERKVASFYFSFMETLGSPFRAVKQSVPLSADGKSSVVSTGYNTVRNLAGNGVWFAGTTALLIFFPVLYGVNVHQMYLEMEKQHLQQQPVPMGGPQAVAGAAEEKPLFTAK